MRDFLRRVWRLASDAAPDLRDALVFGGLGLAAYGAWLIFPPAAWLLAGGALFWIGMRKE